LITINGKLMSSLKIIIKMHNIYIDNFPDAYGMITHYLIKCFKERRNDRKNHFIFYQIINKKRNKKLNLLMEK